MLPVGKTPLVISLSLGVPIYAKQQYGGCSYKKEGFKNA